MSCELQRHVKCAGIGLGKKEVPTGVIEQQGNVVSLCTHFLHVGRFRLWECHVFLHVSNGGFKSDVFVHGP